MNKFLTTKDYRIDILDEFAIPDAWWSRFYEYAFASEFLEDWMTIADAGCGLEHPFKWYAAKRAKKVYCVDMDSRIKDLELDKNMEFIHDDLITFKLPELVDTIFCISVIEHIPKPAIPVVLDTFKMNLKPGGKIILTCDYPTIGPDMMLYYAESVGLKVVGEISYNENDPDNIYNDLYYLKCFSMVLEKEALKEENNIITEEVNKNVEDKKTKKAKKVGDKNAK